MAAKTYDRQTPIERRHKEQGRQGNSATSSHKLRPCRDTWDCILRDSSAHCSQYSHPCPFADRCNKKAMESNLTHESKRVPQCDYDGKCSKMDDLRHRASVWHSNKPNFLKICRDHPRCSNSSYEHRSKYSHGEYKSILNSTSPSSHSQDHRGRRRAHPKKPNERSTGRPDNPAIDHRRSLSAKKAAQVPERSHSPNLQRRAGSKGKSPISPRAPHPIPSRSSSRHAMGSNATTERFPRGDRDRRSKSRDRRSSSSSRGSGSSPALPSRPPSSILRQARRSRSRESDSPSKTSIDRRSLPRSKSK